jgi:hypothetical protein
MNKKNYISLDQCIKGNLYRIDSRNLILGIFDGKTGFIGIRAKFGNKYLFTEYHWDQGPPFGTVQPKEDLGLVPDDFEIYEYRIETIERRDSAVQNEMFEYLTQKELEEKQLHNQRFDLESHFLFRMD